MQRLAAGGMRNLMAAAKTVRHQARLGARRLDCRKKPVPADFQRKFIMPFFVPKRAGHAATAGIDFLHRTVGQFGQSRFRSGCAE
ncbi:MAG: hypothetical protein ILNGONEN_00825 [Syntrophorhabdaceae bacterium]|nr:hypothetical protein [Syntrophorhabdaceae bacterium]